MQSRPRSNSGSGPQPTRSSPRTPTMSTVAVESLLSSIDQMEQLDPRPLQSGTPSPSSSSSLPTTSSSSSSSSIKPEASQSVGTQLRSFVANMQQSLEAANRRSDEATRRADEAIELMKQLIAQQQVKVESKEVKLEQPLPTFVPPSSPSSSSSSSGLNSSHRHQQLLAAVQGDNQGILSIAKSETQQLQHLHNPTVTSLSLPPQLPLTPSQHPMLFLPPRLLHPSPVDNPSSAEGYL